MPIEPASYVSQLNASYPAVGDDLKYGDDHLRLLKAVLLATFPNLAGAIAATDVELSRVSGVTSAIQTQLDAKQAAHAILTALAGLSLAADKLLYATGAAAFSMVDFDAAARTLLTLKKFAGVATFDSSYDEKVNARGTISGAQTIDCTLGTYVTATLSGSTTFTFSNPGSSGYMRGFLLELTNAGTKPTWPASVKWPNGVAPTLTTTGVDLLVFTTIDGGTTWRGSLTQKDSK